MIRRTRKDMTFGLGGLLACLAMLAACQSSTGGNSCRSAPPGSETYRACQASAEAMMEHRWGP